MFTEYVLCASRNYMFMWSGQLVTEIKSYVRVLTPISSLLCQISSEATPYFDDGKITMAILRGDYHSAINSVSTLKRQLIQETEER